MKKVLFLMISVFSLFSCNRDEIDLVFDKQPEERVAEKLDSLKTALLSSPYGWKAALNTNASGGYGFYIDFKSNETVSMVSDFSTATSATLKESTYRVTWTMNAALMFDTYNYITMLQDPTPIVNGGTAGNGLQSDIEFELQKIGPDTLMLKGKRYGNLLTLVKLKEGEQKDYIDGKLKTSISTIAAYLSSHSNNYISIPNLNDKVEIVPNASKGMGFQYVDVNGKVTSVSGKFNYELNGYNFNIPIKVGPLTFVRAELIGGALSFITNTGEKLLVKQNASPILPIETLFAYNKTYNALHWAFNPPAGVTSDFTATANAMINSYATVLSPGRHVLQCYFKLTSSTKAEVAVQSQVSPAGTTYAAGLATYDYKLDENGIITLSNPTYDNNFTARITQLRGLQDYFLSGPFKLVYVSSSDPSVSNLGGLSPVNKPTNIFYGNLRKL